MPEDINDLDVTDAGLKGIFGSRFHDETEPVKVVSKKETPTTNPTAKAEETVMDAPWYPIKERTWMDKLKDCAKSVVLFGSLSCLVFYWQQAGLMASSIAVPTMCILTALAGWGVGKNAR